MSIERVDVIVELHLIDEPYQRIKTAMNGQIVELYFKYNTQTDHWTLDVYKDGKPLLSGRKLVLGIDLLGRYNFGLGSLVCSHITSKETVSEPNRYNLVNGDVRVFTVWKEDVEVD